MSKCEICGREMLKAKGCYKGVVLGHDGKAYPRIKYGDPRESWSAFGFEPTERCGDCGCKLGQFHHPGCDQERCPICGLQMISCDCLTDDIISWDIKEEFMVWR